MSTLKLFIFKRFCINTRVTILKRTYDIAFFVFLVKKSK